MKPKQVDVFVPPCGIYCQECPNFKQEENTCVGAWQGCEKEQCKGIYACCVSINGIEFCFQCLNYPCSRFRQFANGWKTLGQDLFENQDLIKRHGKQVFLELMQAKSSDV